MLTERNGDDTGVKMADFYARTTDQLSNFIENAQAGDTIYLAPGVYAPVSIRNAGSLDILITSLDSENPATITGLNVTGTQNLRFENLTFAADADQNK